jgi:hypothetical protein
VYVKEGGDGDMNAFAHRADLEENSDKTEAKVFVDHLLIEVNQDNDEENDSEKDEAVVVPNTIEETDMLVETLVK